MDLFLLRWPSMPARTPDSRVPIICASESTLVGAEVFNPNLWLGKSKGIVQSCWTEYSVLRHCARQIEEMCGIADRLCGTYIGEIQQQWHANRFAVDEVVVYVQAPDLHMRIEALFSGVKSLLDLLVQLLSSERVVGGAIDGFHRTQGRYGGRVLNALANNASNGKKDVAARVLALISQHKVDWIDQAIQARDQLVHPEKGRHQLMFQLDFSEASDKLVCVRVNPPAIGTEAIDLYSNRVLGCVHEFSSGFLGLLNVETGPDNRMEPTA